MKSNNEKYPLFKLTYMRYQKRTLIRAGTALTSWTMPYQFQLQSILMWFLTWYRNCAVP